MCVVQERILTRARLICVIWQCTGRNMSVGVYCNAI